MYLQHLTEENTVQISVHSDKRRITDDLKTMGT